MDNLASLKNQVLDDLIAVVDDAAVSPDERFEILMARYIENGDTALLGKAYEAAKTIDDPSAKGTALLQLLDEINIASSETEISEVPAEAPITQEQSIETIPQQG